jgi:glutathione-regulated potassium-efflux system ancillary protein KefC
MSHDGFFFQAFVYLAAAVVSVPIAKRIGLGSVLGYLIAGIVIGPFAMGLVGEQGQDVMHFAEFGVVMMLFLVGLELQPALLWKMRGPIFGLGGLQVAATALVGGGIGAALGIPFRESLTIGLILAMSSTAIVLQSLQEKGLLKTPGGQASFAVLLFQDISVIPIFALLPLLAMTGSEASAVPKHGVAALAAWQQGLLIAAVVAGIVFAGRYLIRPVFRFIASTGLREIFTAAALLLVIGISLLVQAVGLSAALGTFLAGVLLADSEYRHELESDIEPFKGLLLGLFFISVGAGIDFGLIRDHPASVAALTAALIVGKFAVLLVLAKVFNLAGGPSLLFAFALAQGGEFCFVLIGFAQQNEVIGGSSAGTMVAAVALSMAVSPLLLMACERWVLPRFNNRRTERPADEIDEHDNPVIIAGFGRFGHVVGRLLSSCGIHSTVLDLDPDQIDLLRKLDLKVFYGDASRLDLLHAAGADRAKLFVMAIDDEPKSLEIVELVRQHFPHLRILARASGRIHAYQLLSRGVTDIYRETLGSSLDLGTDALRALGFRAYEARRAANSFRAHDEAAVRDLAKDWGTDDDTYYRAARRRIQAVDEMMAEERKANGASGDAAWDIASLKEEIESMVRNDVRRD